ncbi:MAG: restriction endonuclease subunit S [Clostridiales bacterium]|nr:restriction endonuclease subunit S [Clostridiales bacterium]
MKTEYKTLGNYIRIIDERNRDLSITNLLGVSISKTFIPSIANIVGTDLSNYKIVRAGQFAYGPVTSRNGEKVSIAYLDSSDCIISSSYTVFEVTNKGELEPEYLMLWFSRPEFDRYARYKSHGSVREIFDWEELCMVELPVPTIDEQKNIVKAYKVITDRIALKKKINDNLEATVQNAFNSEFIAFKGNDNSLVDTELGLIPNNLPIRRVSDIAPRIESGKRPLGGAASRGYPSLGADCAKGLGCYSSSKVKYVPFEFAKNMNRGIVKGYELLAYKDGGKPSEFIPEFSIYGEGYPFDEFAINEHVFLIDFGSPESNWFAYFVFKSKYVYNLLASVGGKSAIPGINQQDIGNLYIIDPTSAIAKGFGEKYLPFLKSILINCKELLNLEKTKMQILMTLSR